MKRFVVLIIGIVLLMTPLTAFAMEREIVYQDGQFVMESDEVVEDNIIWMPGDTIRQTYIVTNQSSDKVRMYMEIHTKTEMTEEMSEWIQITITSKEKGWWFQPELTEDGLINERLEMGVFNSNQVNDVVVELSLSTEADNTCKDVVTELEYVLVAEEVEADIPSTGDSGIYPAIALFISGVCFILFGYKKGKNS